MTAGRDTGGSGQPSWEQLLTGEHASFRAPERGDRAVAPRHGRDGWGDDPFPQFTPLLDDDAMGWGEAAAWTTLAAGVAAVVASRLGEVVR